MSHNEHDDGDTRREAAQRARREQAEARLAAAKQPAEYKAAVADFTKALAEHRAVCSHTYADMGIVQKGFHGYECSQCGARYANKTLWLKFTWWWSGTRRYRRPIRHMKDEIEYLTEVNEGLRADLRAAENRYAFATGTRVSERQAPDDLAKMD